MAAAGWLYEKAKPAFVLPHETRRVKRPWGLLVLGHGLIVAGFLLATSALFIWLKFSVWEGIFWSLLASVLADFYLVLMLYGRKGFRRDLWRQG